MVSVVEVFPGIAIENDAPRPELLAAVHRRNAYTLRENAIMQAANGRISIDHALRIG